MSDLEKLLDELANFGSLMTRGQLTQPRSVGPRIVGIAEEVRALSAQQEGAWQDISTAPKDGTFIIGICNDHSEVYRMSWKLAAGDRMAWCADGQILSFGEGLFNCGGGWIPCPQPVTREQERRRG